MSEPNRLLFAWRLKGSGLSAEEFERLDGIRLRAVGGNIFSADENSSGWLIHVDETRSSRPDPAPGPSLG